MKKEIISIICEEILYIFKERGSCICVKVDEVFISVKKEVVLYV